MLPHTPEQTAAAAFVLLFAVQTLHRRRFGWLMTASLLWLLSLCAAVWWLSSSPILLHDGSLFVHAMELSLLLAHGYVFVSGLLFLATAFKKQPENRPAYWFNTRGDVFLTLLAISGLMMHAAFVLLALITTFQYPQGMSVFYPALLLQLYAFDPINWYGCQALLMALFYLHRLLFGGRADGFSLSQISLGLLLALVWQYLYTAFALAGLFVR